MGDINNPRQVMDSMSPSIGMLFHAFILLIGLALLYGGFRALFTVRSETYNKESLKTNILAALVMIAIGLLLRGSVFNRFTCA